MHPTSHIPVLLSEAVDLLDVKPGGSYLDGTLGGGGHTAEILRRSSPDGKVLSLDVDPQALERAREKFAAFKNRWSGIRANFRHLAEVAARAGMVPLDGILLDLGFSSDQITDPRTGLSFQIQGPLDMRLDPDGAVTAAEIVNGWKEHEIAELLREYGEERHARKIAQAIVSARKKEKVLTTTQLAEIVSAIVSPRSPHAFRRGARIHPATRTFQALRIAVNDELSALREAISAAHEALAPEGRLVIIAFHSLEDRIVKEAFRNKNYWSALTKKPRIPTIEEITQNPRSRSAKLRAAIKK